jgi:hypothetical protein
MLKIKLDRPLVLVGAGTMGKQFLDYIGSENVFCFADSIKAGNTYCEKPVVSFEELFSLQNKYDVVVTMWYTTYSELVKEKLFEKGINKFEYIGEFFSKHTTFIRDDRIAKLKDTHLGETCFIIGNGPSLQASDLEILKKHNVFSFGLNRIFNIFNKTSWRPNAYFCPHLDMINPVASTIKDINCEAVVLSSTPVFNFANPDDELKSYWINDKNVYWFEYKFCRDLSFSSDVSIYANEGGSITYIALQFAAYMGFKKIYLLGVDCDYADPTAQNLNPQNHFYTEATFEKPRIITPVSVITKAYQVAEKYSREHGFRIYNATRGGKLEAFERVKIDELFQ